MPAPNVTPRQQRYFDALRASLERDTGKTLAEWAEIARRCPAAGQRAQLKWLKDKHGLLQNHGIQVLRETFGGGSAWEDPQALISTLWVDWASRAIFDAVDGAASKLDPVLQTARKGYTAWSREFQFAAVRPLRRGTAMLGLALPADASPRLEAPKNEPWSERLKSRVQIALPAEVDVEIEALLRRAWEGAG